MPTPEASVPNSEASNLKAEASVPKSEASVRLNYNADVNVDVIVIAHT